MFVDQLPVPAIAKPPVNGRSDAHAVCAIAAQPKARFELDVSRGCCAVQIDPRTAMNVKSIQAIGAMNQTHGGSDMGPIRFGLVA